MQHEKHEAKEHHTFIHKTEAKVAETVVVAAGGYVLHEHKEKGEAEDEGKKHKEHHHLFG